MAATVVGLLTHLGRVGASGPPPKNVLAIDGGILINWPNYRLRMQASHCPRALLWLLSDILPAASAGFCPSFIWMFANERLLPVVRLGCVGLPITSVTDSNDRKAWWWQVMRIKICVGVPKHI